VADLASRLNRFAETGRTGEIPELSSQFDVRLFNTYRSHCFPGRYPLRLRTRADARGELTEAVKVHGGGGQLFFSSTRPGVIRGDHFHLAKVERFVVLRGEAEIALRRMLHDEVVRFQVSGAEPVVVDMPTMWAHNITNVGSSELLTLFWSNDLFDPARPDTYPERVG
jgi:UDP-2-acetamido-2,6-beta-L-arabino-hexul-4-ose reductase